VGKAFSGVRKGVPSCHKGTKTNRLWRPGIAGNLHSTRNNVHSVYACLAETRSMGLEAVA
jgi:hypothetical protein